MSESINILRSLIISLDTRDTTRFAAFVPVVYVKSFVILPATAPSFFGEKFTIDVSIRRALSSDEFSSRSNVSQIVIFRKSPRNIFQLIIFLNLTFSSLREMFVSIHSDASSLNALRFKQDGNTRD